MIEVREVLRCWLSGAGQRRVAALAGVDRKTVRRYVAAAEAAELDRDCDCGVDQLTDELIGQVVAAVRPDRLQGHGATWEALQANHSRIEKWVKEGLTVGQDHRSFGSGRRVGAAAHLAPLLHAAH